MGTSDFDVETLKNNTDYSGYTATDSVVKYLWEVLKEFSPAEKSMFLKFVYGVSRLSDMSKFKQFNILRLDRPNPDNSLPQAATCFATLKLPEYSSKEILKEKLMYAITNCLAIDNA